MADTLQCPGCATRYQYDPALNGRAIRCRLCATVFRVQPPLPEVFKEGPPPAAGALVQRYYLRFPSGRQFGPVVHAMIEEWVQEGRADGESLVCAEGSSEWLPLGDVFPELLAPPPEFPVQDPYAPEDLPVGAVPAEGILQWLPDEREALAPAEVAHHEAALEALIRECRRTMGAVQFREARMVRMGERIYTGKVVRPAEQLRPESALIAALSSQTGEFYAVLPWGRLGALPHEFFSIVPGTLPAAVALRRRTEEDFAGGQWIGISGHEGDVMAVSARLAQDDLARGVSWKWFSKDRDYMMTLVWGVQAVPLGSAKYLHSVQTSMRVGSAGKEYGVLWYRERQSAFYKFARRLSLPDLHETHIIFGSSTGDLICRVADRSGAH